MHGVQCVLWVTEQALCNRLCHSFRKAATAHFLALDVIRMFWHPLSFLLFSYHHFVHLKVTSANAFAQTLRRYTSLNHLAQAARAVLQNTAQINQMLSDLNRVDFANVQVGLVSKHCVNVATNYVDVCGFMCTLPLSNRANSHSICPFFRKNLWMRVTALYVLLFWSITVWKSWVNWYTLLHSSGTTTGWYWLFAVCRSKPHGCAGVKTVLFSGWSRTSSSPFSSRTR